ncbi:MAG TPA: type II toxin-antitoxin system RelE/ParE family toxin [Candidatus Kapabacteria bacterium]
MAYRIELRASAVKELLSLPEKLAGKVQTAIDALAENPRPFGYKKLEGFKNLFRIRVSDIRIIYSIGDGIKIVEIQSVSNRRETYRKR